MKDKIIAKEGVHQSNVAQQSYEARALVLRSYRLGAKPDEVENRYEEQPAVLASVVAPEPY